LLKRADIKAYREKWATFLQEPERKKAKGYLVRGVGENRCCLGHACYVLDPDQKSGWGNKHSLPPQAIANMLGLVHPDGLIHPDSSPNAEYCNTGMRYLTTLNDDTQMRPQEIGKMLAGMIEGGPGTPFHPLTDYPE
jgi:hypothetical protein